jgi:hypothetical protein
MICSWNRKRKWRVCEIGANHKQTFCLSLTCSRSSLCAETEQIGSETLGQMGRQREQLLITNQYLSDTSQLTLRARQLLQDM